MSRLRFWFFGDFFWLSIFTMEIMSRVPSPTNKPLVSGSDRVDTILNISIRRRPSAPAQQHTAATPSLASTKAFHLDPITNLDRHGRPWAQSEPSGRRGAPAGISPRPRRPSEYRRCTATCQGAASGAPGAGERGGLPIKALRGRWRRLAAQGRRHPRPCW